MTVLPEMLPLIVDLMKMRHVGTLNFTNPGVITHNEILEMYKEIVDPNFTWDNFSIEEQNAILASKRSNNCLNTEKLENIATIKDIKTSVKDIIIQMKSNANTNANDLFVSFSGVGFSL